MKTLSTLLAFSLNFVLIQFALAAVPSPRQEAVPSLNRNHKNMVKAVLHQGTYIAVVDLPQVEIISTKPGYSFQPAVLINGKFIATVSLPVIEITAEAINQKHPVTIVNGNRMIQSELPVVEIISERSYNGIIAATGNDGKATAVYNLPEVVISGNMEDEILVTATLTDGSLIPQMTLQPVMIFPPYEFELNLIDNQLLFLEHNTEWMLVSLKNCGIKIGNKIACEVVTKISEKIDNTEVIQN